MSRDLSKELYAAIFSGHIPRACELIREGADFSYINEWGFNGLEHVVGYDLGGGRCRAVLSVVRDMKTPIPLLSANQFRSLYAGSLKRYMEILAYNIEHGGPGWSNDSQRVSIAMWSDGRETIRDGREVRAYNPMGDLFHRIPRGAFAVVQEQAFMRPSKEQCQLFAAVVRGKSRNIARLLAGNSHMDVNFILPPYKESLLDIAARYGYSRTFNQLIKRGAKFRCAEPEYTAALLLGHIQKRDFKNSLVLIRANANGCLAGPKGMTALHHAAAYGHVELVKALLEVGAEVTAVADDGSTPMALAKQRGEEDACYQMMLKHGISDEARKGDMRHRHWLRM